jgi:hypothetical protein
MDDNKPDKYIEEYWYNLKKSMNNFYKKYNYSRNIDKWSNILNYNQEIQNYDEIERRIRDYIFLYALDVIKSKNKYHFHILYTNIKRWNKIGKKYNFIDCNSDTHKIVFILIDIYNKVINDIINDNILLFEDIEIYILNRNFDDFIRFAINNNKPGILNDLSNIVNVKNIISDIYGIDCGNMSFNKIIKKINII